MNKSSPRIKRIDDVIHHELSKLLQQEIKDPRLGFVTITEVDVSQDLRHAKIFITVLENEKMAESITILNNAAGFLRSSLAAKISLRVMPELRFIYDESINYGNKMEALLASLTNASTN